MTIEVEREYDGQVWDAVLAESTGSTCFHSAAVLRLCADQLDATLHPFIGYKGQEPVGLFPLFELQKGPVTGVFSPPPELKIPYLGPTLTQPETLKPRKREQWNYRFVEAVLDSVERDINPRFTNVRTTPTYGDERPFVWSGYDVTPRYTYRLDLTPDEDELLTSFNREARRAVTEHVGSVDIAVATEAEVDRILTGVAGRHDEKDADYHFPRSFATRLYRMLPDDTLQAYVCRQDGELCGGMLTFEDEDTGYGWQSYGDLTRSVPVSDLLFWHAFREAKSRGCTTFDLVGANDRGLARYKAKFAPELHRYQALNRGTNYAKGAVKLYSYLR
ncbi:GNAT family N-acetyltransferase [Haloarchaeobius sp. DFWS5]|uniref:GNAT family N-acetyltransferase n=1 Tax=Haloarchaeobius sp. DFWS5 TaxID=3446114 RepID=UPI003EC0772B